MTRINFRENDVVKAFDKGIKGGLESGDTDLVLQCFEDALPDGWEWNRDVIEIHEDITEDKAQKTFAKVLDEALEAFKASK